MAGRLLTLAACPSRRSSLSPTGPDGAGNRCVVDPIQVAGNFEIALCPPIADLVVEPDVVDPVRVEVATRVSPECRWASINHERLKRCIARERPGGHVADKHDLSVAGAGA